MTSGRIVWLASYPKSGNTWVRILLANYLHGETSINDLGGMPIASARTMFDEPVGIEASTLPDELVRRLRPAAYQALADEAEERLYVKVHDAWQRTDLGAPLFPEAATAATVYVVRNPLDVAGSLAAHRGTSITRAVEDLCDPDFAFSRREGMSAQLRQHLGTWSAHVDSWTVHSGLPVHVVRYEDLLADTAASFAGILEHLDIERDDDRLRGAVQRSSFAVLRASERSDGFRERPPAADVFFRRGRAGGWRDELDGAQVAQLCGTHAEVMHRLGYPTDCSP